MSRILLNHTKEQAIIIAMVSYIIGATNTHQFFTGGKDSIKEWCEAYPNFYPHLQERLKGFLISEEEFASIAELELSYAQVYYASKNNEHEKFSRLAERKERKERKESAEKAIFDAFKPHLICVGGPSFAVFDAVSVC